MQGGEERRELLLAASAKATMMTAMTMTMMTTMMTTTTTTLLSSVGGPSLFQQRDHVHIQALTAAAALDQGGWQTCWEGQPAICHRHPNWWRFVVTVMIHVMEGGGVAAALVVVSRIMVLRHMYVFGAYKCNVRKYQFHV